MHARRLRRQLLRQRRHHHQQQQHVQEQQQQQRRRQQQQHQQQDLQELQAGATPAPLGAHAHAAGPSSAPNTGPVPAPAPAPATRTPVLGVPLALVLAALLWPCMAGLPYALGVITCLLGWAWGMRPGLLAHPTPLLRLMQLLASMHLLLQYMHQVGVESLVCEVLEQGIAVRWCHVASLGGLAIQGLLFFTLQPLCRHHHHKPWFWQSIHLCFSDSPQAMPSPLFP